MNIVVEASNLDSWAHCHWAFNSLALKSMRRISSSVVFPVQMHVGLIYCPDVFTILKLFSLWKDWFSSLISRSNHVWHCLYVEMLSNWNPGAQHIQEIPAIFQHNLSILYHCSFVCPIFTYAQWLEHSVLPIESGCGFFRPVVCLALWCG